MENSDNITSQTQNTNKSLFLKLPFTDKAKTQEINIEGRSQIKFDILLFKKGRKNLRNMALFVEYKGKPIFDDGIEREQKDWGQFMLLNFREFETIKAPEDIDSVVETRKNCSLKTLLNCKTVNLTIYTVGNEPFDFDVFLDLE